MSTIVHPVDASRLPGVRLGAGAVALPPQTCGIGARDRPGPAPVVVFAGQVADHAGAEGRCGARGGPLSASGSRGPGSARRPSFVSMPTDDAEMPTDDAEIQRRRNAVTPEVVQIEVLRSRYLNAAEAISSELDLLLRVFFEVPNRKVRRFHQVILPRMTLGTRINSLEVITKHDRPPEVADLLAKLRAVVKERNFLAHASIGPGVVDHDVYQRNELADWEVQATISRSGIFTRKITTDEIQGELLVAVEVVSLLRALVATVFANPGRDYEPAAWAETITNPPYGENGILHAPAGFHDLFKMMGPAPPGVEPADDFDF